MYKIFICILSIIFTSNAFGQIISQFDWDSNPVTTATVGPDAVSVSSSAVSASGGVGGTNGLNANLSGTPKLDINFTLADSSIFDVPGIDFSIDYHREESQAEFFTRGSSLNIGAGNQFDVTYRVDDGAGGFNTVSSGNAYNIPNDNTFRRYRFYYLPSTGEGFLTVDGAVVWTNDGPDNRNLYWVGAGDIVIGSQMDGSGNNATFLDNMVIGSITNSALPVTLTKFKASLIANEVVLNWQTKSEINNERFEIERAVDATNWMTIATVKGSGNSSETIDYSIKDNHPLIGQSYYRLVQYDFDGTKSVFQVKSILNQPKLNHLTVYPNPASEFIQVSLSNNEIQTYAIFSLNGIKVLEGMLTSNRKIDVSDLKNGVYILAVNGEQSKIMVNH